jgi:hypothetical protein
LLQKSHRHQPRTRFHCHQRGNDGGQLGAVLERGNTASDIWATAPLPNQVLLERRGLRPQFQRKKHKGKKMPGHSGPRQRDPRPGEIEGRTRFCRPEMPARARLGVVRARVKMGLANLAYNFTGWLGSVAKPPT